MSSPIKVPTSITSSRLSQALPAVPDGEAASKSHRANHDQPPSYSLLPAEERRPSSASSAHDEDDNTRENAPLLPPSANPQPLTPNSTTNLHSPYSESIYNSAYESGTEYESDGEEHEHENEHEHEHFHHHHSHPFFESLTSAHGLGGPPCPHEIQQMQLQTQMMFPHLLGPRGFGHEEPFIIIIDPPGEEMHHGFPHPHAHAQGQEQTQMGGETPPPPYEAIYMQRGNALEVSGAVGLVGYDWNEDEEFDCAEELGGCSGERAELVCKYIICALMLSMVVIVSVGSAVNWGQSY